MGPIVKLLGIGGAEIRFTGLSVFIDAFNDYNVSPVLDSNDIVLFTHGDGDHFNASKTLKVSGENQIIGPPCIAYPLLANTGLDAGLLKIVYPPNLQSPVELEIGELKLKIYQTKHFIGWEPDHISFLLKYSDKKIYFTGDSHSFYFEDSELYELDSLIYSLVNQDVVAGKMNGKDGARLHVQELSEIQNKLKPKRIIGNHLIDCGWTVSTTGMKNEIAVKGLKNITIPESSEDEIPI